MRTRIVGKGLMAFKLDLKKAYDRFSWDLIFNTQHEVGLLDQMVSLLMKCITTVSFKGFWNGEVTDSFTPSKGIRQSDPVSPYIFVLCIERFAHKINLAVSEGQWKPIKIARKCPELSHLFFIDDVMLFAEASLSQVQVI